MRARERERNINRERERDRERQKERRRPRKKKEETAGKSGDRPRQGEWWSKREAERGQRGRATLSPPRPRSDVVEAWRQKEEEQHRKSAPALAGPPGGKEEKKNKEKELKTPGTPDKKNIF